MYKLLCVTDMQSCSRPLLEQLKIVFASDYSPQIVVLRAKELSEEAYFELAQAVLPLCQAYGVELRLNTYWQAAKRLGLTSIHVPLPMLRSVEFQQQSSGFTTISTSVHAVEEVTEALALGAQELIAGHIYATQCKAGEEPRGLEFLQRVCQKAQAVPVYAIGGIKFEAKQWQELAAAGAKGACIMSGYMEL